MLYSTILLLHVQACQRHGGVPANHLTGAKNRPKPLIPMAIPALMTRLADMMLMYSDN